MLGLVRHPHIQIHHPLCRPLELGHEQPHLLLPGRPSGCCSALAGLLAEHPSGPSSLQTSALILGLSHSDLECSVWLLLQVSQMKLRFFKQRLEADGMCIVEGILGLLQKILFAAKQWIVMKISFTSVQLKLVRLASLNSYCGKTPCPLIRILCRMGEKGEWTGILTRSSIAREDA